MCNNMKRELEEFPEIEEIEEDRAMMDEVVGSFYEAPEPDIFIGHNYEIIQQCKAWWDMTIDNDWSELRSRFRGEVMAYLDVFDEETEGVWISKDPKVWIKFHTLCQNMKCALDCDTEQDFIKCANAFEWLWQEYMVPYVGEKPQY